MNKEKAPKTPKRPAPKATTDKTAAPEAQINKKRKLNSQKASNISQNSQKASNIPQNSQKASNIPQNTQKQTKTTQKAAKFNEKHAQSYKKPAQNQEKNRFNSKKQPKTEQNNGKPAIEAENDIEFGSEGKNMILITKMNKLATKLFEKSKEKASEKPKIIENILNKIGVLLPRLINKRSASKFIQACYKFGSPEQRTRIFNCLKETDFSEAFKSKYGHFLLVKMAKKGTKEQKNRIFEEIYKNAWFFASHKEAGQVMDAFLRTSATPQQISKIKSLFKLESEGAAVQKTERIENIAMRIIEKDLTQYQISQFILCKVFPLLIPNEREKVLEKFKDCIMDLAKTKEGVNLALEIINYSNNKQKKALMKGLKGKLVETITCDTEKRFLIVLKLLGAVDDREALNKYLIKEIAANLETILKTRSGIELISSLFIPKHNVLGVMERDNKFSTCKKDADLRREEIVGLLLPHLTTFLSSDLPSFLRDVSLSRVISHIIQKALSEEELFEEHKDFIEKVVECFENEMEQGFSGSDPEEINRKYLITHPDANRVLKGVIRMSNETKSDSAKGFLEGKLDKIYQFLAKNWLLNAKTRAIFLIIALIENTNYKDVVVQNVNKIKGKIPENTQGLNILKQII